MVSLKKCISDLESRDSKIRVVNAKDYGTDFLLTYSYDGRSNVPDPFLLVNKKTGLVKTYTIAENPGKYYSTPNIYASK